MKQILFKTIACCAALLTFAACDKSGDLPDDGAGTGTGSIYLNLSSRAVSAPSSRAFDTAFETRVDHLDVLIFDTDGNKMCHEHFETGAATEGRLTLAVKRSAFVANAGYWVYLIANANDIEQEKFALADYNLNRLKSEVRNNPYIHLTGMPNNTTNGAGYELPQNFLMDGAAYSGAAEPATAGPVVLNDGDTQADTNLKVTLRRAAVKLVLHITKGPAIKITDPLDLSGLTNTSGYYLRNMPYTTLLLPPTGGGFESLLRTPRQTRNHYFELHSSGLDPEDPEGKARLIDAVTITAYVYSHSWASGSNMTQETRWIVDIPLKYDNGTKDRVVETYEHSYYQIPVCKGTDLERNTCYTVNVELNSPGGTSPSQPAALEGVEYVVEDWIPKSIPIGGDESRPMYLTLNRTEMEMHNTDTDATTLEFASSSEVTASVTRVYYVDKLGVEVDEATSVVTLTPDTDLNGNIKIESPVPTNNTIRYIEIKVTNKDNVTPRYVTIKQYPLEFILNIQGWYSYRTDFLHDENNEKTVTTYELLNGEDVKDKTYYNVPFDDNDWICGCAWNATTNTWDYTHDGTGFFGSKVAGPVATSGADEGKAYIYYYRWERTRTSWRYTYSVDFYNEYLHDDDPKNDEYENKGVWRKYSNPRMYHIRLTASSDKYTIGRPRITDGKTDPGADNAKLVSPSFLIASQLGAVMSTTDVNVAADHCKHYVEVYKDKSGNAVHLKDWRLPTAAEIQIIIDFQKTSDAMDEVLSGKTYWSASGLVETVGTSSAAPNRIRCVRDAYDIQDADKDAGKDAGTDTTTDTAADAQ